MREKERESERESKRERVREKEREREINRLMKRNNSVNWIIIYSLSIKEILGRHNPVFIYRKIN